MSKCDFDSPFYMGMFTNAGNKAVYKLVERVLAKAKITDSSSNIVAKINAGRKLIAKKHSEVFDSDVSESIAHKLRKATGREFSRFDV